jgi:hypothetical protein
MAAVRPFAPGDLDAVIALGAAFRMRGFRIYPQRVGRDGGH